MLDFFARLFDPSGFPPRWQCGLWTAGHGWLHIVSDVAVWAAYFVIPGILAFYFVRRKGLPFRRIMLLFVAFILACGTTHLMEAVIFWWPAYRLAGALKLVTAVVSWGTVFALVRVTPTVLAFRPPAELEAEIADRRRAEDALRASEVRFRLLVEGVKDYAIYLLDPAGHVASWNSGAERITGYTAAEAVGLHLSRFYPPEVADTHPQEELAAALADGRYEEEGRRVRKDGTVYWAAVTITALTDAAGRHVGYAKITRDVSERRAAEDRTVAALREKEVLLREIHHRVKNNLQIISTLLDLQTDYTTDPHTLALFRECRGRVKSMALIHEQLYRSEDAARVALANYVQQLSDSLRRMYKVSEDRIALDVDVTAPPLPIDTAVPLGLLLNELLTNCFKHAFAGRAEGRVRVALRPDAGGDITLTVADDGTGFPADTDFRDTPSLGLQLVNTLVRQLGGRIDLDATAGTAFTVRFPLPQKPPAEG